MPIVTKVQERFLREAYVAKAAWKFSNDRPRVRTGDKDRRLDAHKSRDTSNLAIRRAVCKGPFSHFTI